MTDQRELDRLLAAFFVEGTDELADRVIDAALDHIDHTDQRRAVRMPRRFQTMNMLTRVAAAAVIGVLAVGGAFYLTRPDRPAVGGPSPEPTASFIASVPTSPSASPSLAVVQTRPPVWTATGSMDRVRGAGQTATLLLDGKVLVAGGGGSHIDNDIDPLASAELYDPDSGFWTATGNMAAPRFFFTATLLSDGKVLVTGGESSHILGRQAVLASAELYDPGSGSWTVTGNMGTPRVYHTATLLPDGKVLVMGGSGNGEEGDPLASAELYDPGSGSWTATGNMVMPRVYQTATLLHGGKVLVTGGLGADFDHLVSAELYDPGSGSWTATGNMARVRSQGHTATLLPDGKVLVAGSTTSTSDDSGNEPVAVAELYDPGSGSWTLTGPMELRRYFHTATLLPDGTVLVVGGGTSMTSHNGPLASAELYDPSTGSWTTTRSMVTPRYFHTATLLLDGRVLVVGDDIDPLASSELYDPGSGN